MVTRTVAVLAAILIGSVSPAAIERQEAAASDQPATVFLLRHAEKAESTTNERDPSLSEAGRQRARALARLLGKAKVTHLFSSEFVRTNETLAPLAEAAGLEVQVIPARDGEDQVRALVALPPGSIAVVCGHSNTIPALVAALGGTIDALVDHPTYGPMLGDDEYDRLFVVIRPVAGESAQTIELRYGAAERSG
jgi:phosphohistidine phosphatase SixA